MLQMNWLISASLRGAINMSMSRFSTAAVVLGVLLAMCRAGFQ
jgi:hypothetical protein